MSANSPGQLLLFEVVQTAHADGSFTVRPKRLTDGREIGSKQAAKMLGLHRQTISDLCAAGELEAWKTASVRGNAKWRIAWQSVIDYKARRKAAASRE